MIGKCTHLLPPSWVHKYGTLDPNKEIWELTGLPGIVFRFVLIVSVTYIRQCVDPDMHVCVCVCVCVCMCVCLRQLSPLVHNCVCIVCYDRNVVDVE